jgi:hypothetical protein
MSFRKSRKDNRRNCDNQAGPLKYIFKRSYKKEKVLFRATKYIKIDVNLVD